MKNNKVAYQRGMSLLELLVSMAIGLVVIGALVITYLNGSTGGRTALAQAQMSEDAQFALNLLSRDLREAGYNSGAPDLGRGGFAIFACDKGFSNGVADGNNSVTVANAMNQLVCDDNGLPGASAALAVAYSADAKNTVPSTDNPPQPTDCLRAALGPGTGLVVENRYFVKDAVLRCAGSAPNASGAQFRSSQPLVSNIESMSFEFGLAGANKSSQISGYVNHTDEIGPASKPDAPQNATLAAIPPDSIGTPPVPISVQASRWRLVRTVRVCVVARSELAVVSDTASQPQYVDCNGEKQNILDGRLRRAFATTAMLRNLP